MFDLSTWIIGGTAAVGVVRSAADIYGETQKPDPPVQKISLTPPRDYFEMKERLLKAQAIVDSQLGRTARDLAGGQFRVTIRGGYSPGGAARLTFSVFSNHTVGKIEVLSGQGSVLGAGTCAQWGDNLFRAEVSESVFENWWRSTPNNRKSPKKNRMLPLRLYAKYPQGEASRTFVAWATETTKRN